MKKCLLLGLLTAIVGLCSMTSCGGDTDEQMCEELIGYWKGPFVQAGYEGNDTTSIVYSQTDSNTVLHIYYPYIIVRGKKGIGMQYETKNSVLDSISFEWEVKYGKFYLYYNEHPERDFEIYNYKSPIDGVFEGIVETVPFKLKKY